MDEMSLINALIVVPRIPPFLGYNTVYPVTFFVRGYEYMWYY